MGHYFFFSYARRDWNTYVERFFTQLTDEIRSHAGVGDEINIGFRDNVSIPLGSAWERTLMGALSDSSTFVALCTPTYFKSPQCGREWSLFDERLSGFPADERPPVMLPLLWVRNTRLPAVAQRVQYATDQLGPRYANDGLLNWFRRGLYQRRALLIEALAEHIIQARDRYELPVLPSTERFESAINAFGPPDDALNAPAVPDRPVVVAALPAAGDGRAATRADQKVRMVHFVIAAGTRSEMSGVRRQTEFYKDRDRDWQPYPLAEPPALARMAANVALDNDFGARIGAIEELPRLRASIREHNELLVLLMDAWVTRSAKRRAVERFNDGFKRRDVVLVPLNEQDSETYLQWRELKPEVLELLDPYFTKVGDHRPLPLPVLDVVALPRMLHEALVAANNDLFRDGKVRRRLPGRDGEEPPLLSAPTR
ncbi:TIR domain-containing protein [Dactylosporangium vinaceum]|uniref:FxsC protein n=1 Tax=Dactylosporangium vinaceum TaxID=53362 RepID=A0ABV5MES7_9ACTN|nr:FxsC protein [Dactylosporangium vinaceum]UAB97106.1 TIR domain-containing protein [Dactylosporangium vinaceum]